MAFLFADSFDFYPNSAALTLRWDSASLQGSYNYLTAPATAFGWGQALDSRSLTVGTSTLTKALGSNNASIFGSIALEWLSNASLSTAYVALVFGDTTNAQCSILWHGDGSITVTSGGPGGTVLATYSSAFYLNVWNFWQFSVTINSTAGQVQIRINGATTDTYNLTGVDTRAGSSNNYANSISLDVYVPSGGANCFAIDNLFLVGLSGATPDGWLGPMVAFGQVPISDVQAQWSPVFATPSTFGASGTMTYSGSANVVVWSGSGPLMAAPISGSCTEIAFNLTSSFTGNMILGLYSNSSGSPGTLLGHTANISNPTSGLNYYSLISPVNVTAGQQFFIAILTDTSYGANYQAPSGATSWFSQSVSFSSGLPSSGSSATNNGGPVLFSVLGLVVGLNYSAIGTFIENGGTNYVETDTVGKEDIYGMFQTNQANGYKVVGVSYSILSENTDVAAHAISLSVNTDGSGDTAIGSDSPVPASYAYSTFFTSKDPAGQAWTGANVDAAQVGIKLSS